MGLKHSFRNVGAQKGTPLPNPFGDYKRDVMLVCRDEWLVQLDFPILSKGNQSQYKSIKKRKKPDESILFPNAFPWLYDLLRRRSFDF